MQWVKDYNNNYYQNSLQYQYSNTNIGELLKGISSISEAYINQAIETLFNDVINLRTAVGGGLDMWGKRLGFSRFIPINNETPQDYINFNFYDGYFKNLKFFDTNVKYVGLPDFNYRLILLLLLAQQSITPNIKAIDSLVNEVFEKLNISVIVKDTTDMSYITFVFKQEIPAWLGWIFKNYDVFPRPAGVGASYIVDLHKPFTFSREDIELNKEITNFYYGIFKGSTKTLNPNNIISHDYEIVFQNLTTQFEDIGKELIVQMDIMNELQFNPKHIYVSGTTFDPVFDKVNALGKKYYAFYNNNLIPAFIDNIAYINKKNEGQEQKELYLLLPNPMEPPIINQGKFPGYQLTWGKLLPTPEVTTTKDGVYIVTNYDNYKPKVN